MKVLFLDIDDVLNSCASMIVLGNEEEEFCLDPIAVGLLKELCNRVDINIVISSSWRIRRNVEDFRSMFRDIYKCKLSIIDITPTSKRGVRGRK